MSTKHVLLYGSTGYTGRLIARMAGERGIRPILAGRDERAVAAQAAELGLEHRAFSLDDPAVVAAGLDGVAVVLHCAGPFSRSDWLMLTVIATVVVAHFFYYFSGGPDFGARYWFLIVVPLVVLAALSRSR